MRAKDTMIVAGVVFLSFANSGQAAMVSLDDLAVRGNGALTNTVFDAYQSQFSLAEAGPTTLAAGGANPLYSKFSSANIDISEMDISSAPVPITVALVSAAMIALGALGRRPNHPRT